MMREIIMPELKQGVPLLSLGNLMDFVRFHAATSKGRITSGGQITADSSNTFMEWFFAGFKRVTGTEIDGETRSNVYKVSHCQGRRARFMRLTCVL